MRGKQRLEIGTHFVCGSHCPGLEVRLNPSVGYIAYMPTYFILFGLFFVHLESELYTMHWNFLSLVNFVSFY